MKALFAVVALTTFGQVAQAAESATPPATGPFVLSDAQMDQVTAGAFIINDLATQRQFEAGVAALPSTLTDARGITFTPVPVEELRNYNTFASDQLWLLHGINAYISSDGYVWCCDFNLRFLDDGYAYNGLNRYGLVGDFSDNYHFPSFWNGGYAGSFPGR
jgi:hypothetical protein